MVNQELTLKQLGHKSLLIIRNKKNLFKNTFIVIMLLSSTYFLKVVYLPNYKSTTILKCKSIRFDQIKQSITKLNHNITNPELNKANDSIKSCISNLALRSINFSEMASNDDIPSAEKNNNFKLYNFELIFKNNPLEINVDKYQNIIINFLQSNSEMDNEVMEEKIKLRSQIIEVDSLITIAYAAGVRMKDNTSNANILIMENIYKEIDELIKNKYELTKQLNLLDNNNIIFQTAPMFISNKVEIPWIIFFIAFSFWILICSFIIGGNLIFGEE